MEVYLGCGHLRKISYFMMRCTGGEPHCVCPNLDQDRESGAVEIDEKWLFMSGFNARTCKFAETSCFKHPDVCRLPHRYEARYKCLFECFSGDCFAKITRSFKDKLWPWSWCSACIFLCRNTTANYKHSPLTGRSDHTQTQQAVWQYFCIHITHTHNQGHRCNKKWTSRTAQLQSHISRSHGCPVSMH